MKGNFKMTDKEIENKFKELEIRMKGLELMINTTYDLALQFGTFNQDWINKLKKHLK